MTDSLFSIFDPSSGVGGMSLGWAASAAILSIFSGYWVTRGALHQVCSATLSGLEAEIKAVLGTPMSSSLNLIVVGLFLFILMNNMFGLLPFVFTGTSHLVFTGIMSLGLWSGFTVVYFFHNSAQFLAHLVPIGTPVLLVPFMVIIELVSSLMRPLTLAVRLAANMIAGHLLLDLCATPLITSSPLAQVCFFSALMALSSLELGVAVIQAYVFTSLSALYLAEVNAPNL